MVAGITPTEPDLAVSDHPFPSRLPGPCWWGLEAGTGRHALATRGAGESESAPDPLGGGLAVLSQCWQGQARVNAQSMGPSHNLSVA